MPPRVPSVTAASPPAATARGLRTPTSVDRASPQRRDSSSANSCVRLTLFVQFVRIRNRTMSETISSGGFSSASGVLAGAGRRRRRGPRAAPCTPRRSGAASRRRPSRRRPCPSACPARSSTPRPPGRLAQQPAQVEEVLLRRRAFLQLGRAPLRDEGVQRHAAARARESAPPRPTTTPSGRPSTASAAPPGRALQRRTFVPAGDPRGSGYTGRRPRARPVGADLGGDSDRVLGAGSAGCPAPT